MQALLSLGEAAGEGNSNEMPGELHLVVRFALTYCTLARARLPHTQWPHCSPTMPAATKHARAGEESGSRLAKKPRGPGRPPAKRCEMCRTCTDPKLSSRGKKKCLGVTPGTVADVRH